MPKTLKDLTAQEVLALAIQAEEEDGRIYADLAERVGKDYPETAKSLKAMHDEEDGHRHRLIDLYREKYGEHIPLIRRQDVKGFVNRRPIWMIRPLGLDTVRGLAGTMEAETRRFYEAASAKSRDPRIRQLLDDLAQEERAHQTRAEELEDDKLEAGVKAQEDEASRKLFLLQIVQPGLAGLMDGSVSTLAPGFAAALATHRTWDAFRVGLAASG